MFALPSSFSLFAPYFPLSGHPWSTIRFHFGNTDINGYPFWNFNWSIIDLQYCISFCCTMKWISYVKVAQSGPTLCDPMDYTVRGILQARILEWVAFPVSRRSSQPRDQTQVSCTAGRFFTSWAIREAQIEKKRSFEKDSKIHFFFSSSTPLWNGFYISYNHLQTCKSRCPINYTKSFKLRLEVKKVQFIANVK